MEKINSICRELLSAHGGLSMMRLMSLLCVIIAGIIALYGICHGGDYYGLAVLCTAFLTAGFTGKIMQKKTEVGTKEDGPK